MTENQVSRVVIESALKVHRALGPGLLEAVYESALAFEVEREGLFVQRQQAIPVVYDGVNLGHGFRADLIVDGKVIVEIKSLELVPPVAYEILLTYLRLTGKHLGLLINFGEETLRGGFKRVVNNLTE